jgi:hypothetical protein
MATKYTQMATKYTQMAPKYTQMATKYTQMASKYTKIFYSRPSKINPNWDFWYENKPSGNPGLRLPPSRQPTGT